MSRKTLTIHLYCLFLFIGGCGIFWLFGGGDGEKTNLEDNKVECTAQQTTDNIATTWEEQSDTSTDDDDADAEPTSTFRLLHKNLQKRPFVRIRERESQRQIQSGRHQLIKNQRRRLKLKPMPRMQVFTSWWRATMQYASK